MTREEAKGKTLNDCPLVGIGIDIGDKDECAIYEYKGAKEWQVLMA